MSYSAGYFMKANEGVYSVVRSALPPDFSLVTLRGQSGRTDARPVGAQEDVARDGADGVAQPPPTGQFTVTADRTGRIQRPDDGPS